MSQKIIFAMPLLACASVFSGCATIVSDNKYPVVIDTFPSGAEFTIKNENGVAIHSGVTPDTVVLKSGAGYFKKQSYSISCKTEDQSTNYQLDSELDGWYIGNLAFGGLIGLLIVDPATGSMWKLPETVNINMDGIIPEAESDSTDNFYE